MRAPRRSGIRPILAALAAAATLSLAILTVRSGSSGSGGPSTAAKKPAGPPPCEAGTLGLEAAPITRELRKKLSLANDFRGGIVAVVYPGGPAAEAGILVNDVVEQVGSVRIGNDCELEDAAFSRSCETARVKVRRGSAAAIEMAVTPADQNFFYDKLCRAGNVGGCYRQGWALWVRNGGKGADRAAALELLHAACKSGSSDACAYQGLKLMDVPGRGSDSIVALERSCLLNNGAGCTHLGFLHATGKLVLKDDRRAVARYVKGCDLGDARGCYNVGLMAEEGRGGAKDLSRAAAKYDEGCRMGSSTACTNLGFLYERGHGVKLDKARAVVLYQRGCDGTSCQPPNLTGCVNVGRAYRDGIGVPKDAAHAASIFQLACGRKADPDDLHSAENRSRSCSLLGGLYLAGDGVEKDLARGRKLSESACEQGDTFGCFNAAVTATNGWGGDRDLAKAASFLETACKGGDGEGCNDLAAAYEKGSGVARDRRRATELYRRACELGFEKACPKKGR